MVVKIISEERNPTKYRRIVGVDSSSTGIAWTALFDGDMMGQGKINLTKIKTMQDKMVALYKEWQYLLRELQPDHIFIEKSIFVKNPATARTLSYIVGSVMVVSLGEGYEITDVEPASWKSFMGYHNLSSKFVAAAKKELGSTEGKKFCDKLRKSQTWRVIQHNYPDQAEDTMAMTDHDIADAWGLALYGYNKLGRELQLEKSKDISLDLEEFDRLGLVL